MRVKKNQSIKMAYGRSMIFTSNNFINASIIGAEAMFADLGHFNKRAIQV